MPIETRAALMRRVGEPLSVETLSLAEPGPGEVLVRMGAAGVCHSDYHVISGQGSHDLPVVLGHEGAGIVAATGAGVSDLARGDRVVLNWRPSCGSCFHCRHEETHLCTAQNGPLWDGTLMDGTCRLAAGGEPVRQLSMIGVWSEWAVVPRLSCVRLPGEVPMEVAALLGCAISTGVGAVLNRARVRPGESVAVIGAGGVGLSIIMGAALAGARRIIAIDRAPAVEAIARRLGATSFIDANDDMAGSVMAVADHGADVVFEAVGRRTLQREALDLARPGGRVVYVGLDAEDATIALPTTAITRAEKWVTGSIFGSVQADRDLVAYAEHFRAGRLPVDALIGRRYRLDQINEAIDDMLASRPGRGVILFNEKTA